MENNPQTVNRIYNRLVEMGIDEIYEKSTEPKETNRQIGSQFTRWIKTGTLSVSLINQNEFIATKSDAILNASDNKMKNFANENLGYRNKGLDFITRFNGI